MAEWDALITIADRLGTLAVLVVLVVALVTGRIPTAGRLQDWQHYAAMWEKRAVKAEEALAENTREIAKLSNVLENMGRHIEILSVRWKNGGDR